MNKLRFWRLERGLSPFELAVASNVPRYVIQLAEQGLRHPSSEEQLSLAETLGTATAKLFPKPKTGLPYEDQMVEQRRVVQRPD